MNKEKTPKSVENTSQGSRVRAPEAAQPNRDKVSVSKDILSDGSERTRVMHPPRMLRTPGQIKAAYESGLINLSQFTKNVNEGMAAMAPVLKTNTEGSGKDRITTQSITMMPDYAMRLKWQEHITNTVEGMPVKRQEIVSKKIMTQEDLMEKAKQSPALLRSLLAQLTELDAEIRADLSNKGGGHN